MEECRARASVARSRFTLSYTRTAAASSAQRSAWPRSTPRSPVRFCRASDVAIAAGHLREAILSAAIRRRRTGRFVALDADAESCAEVQRCYARYGVESVIASFRTLLSRRSWSGQFDLVYSTGLFDYLSQRTGARLVATMFDMLRPGGQLLVVDGDFVSKSRAHRLLARLLGMTGRTVEGGMAERHTGILSRVHFSTGARAVKVALLLEQAGFTEIKIDTRLGQIHNAQRSGLGWKRALLRLSEHRYAISARKRPFNSLGCIVCRSGLYSLPVLAKERQDALENQY